MLGLWWWSRSEPESRRACAIRHQLVRFMIAFGLALVAASALKLLFDFPRPPAVFGNLVRVIGQTELHYTLPSGHSTYAALVVGTLWPLVGTRLRITLVLYLVLVGWSRIAAGMHFPADVVAGWALGLVCVGLAHRLQSILAATVAVRWTASRWYGLATAIVIVDQSAKFAIAHTFAYGEQVPITPFFSLVHARNSGAAFSMLADAGGWQRYCFIILAFGVSTWLVRMLRQGLPRIEAVGYCLILGGALGNVVDRILRGQVIDFLDFHWQAVHWLAFNLADVTISLGAMCLIVATTKQNNRPHLGTASS